jgi:hypothetical protein
MRAVSQRPAPALLLGGSERLPRARKKPQPTDLLAKAVADSQRRGYVVVEDRRPDGPVTLMPDPLTELAIQDRRFQDPRAWWRALHYCDQHRLPKPPWVESRISELAARLVAIDKELTRASLDTKHGGARVGALLARALGFSSGRRGPGTALARIANKKRDIELALLVELLHYGPPPTSPRYPGSWLIGGERVAGSQRIDQATYEAAAAHYNKSRPDDVKPVQWPTVRDAWVNWCRQNKDLTHVKHRPRRSR